MKIFNIGLLVMAVNLPVMAQDGVQNGKEMTAADVVEQVKQYGEYIDLFAEQKRRGEELDQDKVNFTNGVSMMCMVLHGIQGDEFYKKGHLIAVSINQTINGVPENYIENSADTAANWLPAYMEVYNLNKEDAAKYMMSDLSCMKTL
ncbi:hypothetical protein [Vibrio maritimus]|uniref:hypothetical protein n=1 Tax=Vibrio maritimus TaxID=990268 RepID=UPI001F36E302|nr:hypothetical protein [Vibrio maritimus]